MNSYQKYRKNKLIFPLIIPAVFLLFACSFDYGAGQDSDGGKPDITMVNIEYARVRSGDLLERFHAEHAERWEDRQIMVLRDFSFEQMEEQGDTVNVEGTAGAAQVYLETGDIVLYNGVKISIESEDVIIISPGFEWRDSDKNVIGEPGEEVEVQRSDGTSFTGKGFFADIRRRTWSFSGEVSGSFVEEDDDEEE